MKAYGAGGFMRMFFGCPAGARKTRLSKYYGSVSFHSIPYIDKIYKSGAKIARFSGKISAIISRSYMKTQLDFYL